MVGSCVARAARPDRNALAAAAPGEFRFLVVLVRFVALIILNDQKFLLLFSKRSAFLSNVTP
jgi:hypothetical protein